ncbi:MAG: hypothetical protein LBC88_00400 [Spirochaetaceae bacterium]|jgi:hypothetical protein|nr:hypothetical protein [Spirochaetaceae bacterium]
MTALMHRQKRRGKTGSAWNAISDDASEIGRGIRETIKGIRLSILAMGIGLAQIKARRLFVDLRCHSMAKYIEALCEDTQMERSGLFNWLYIGEAWLKYRKDLERIGFSDEDGPTKLPYVEWALGVYPKKDVFRVVKEMSLRQFIGFSRREAAAPAKEEVMVKGNKIYVGGRQAVTLDEGLDRKPGPTWKASSRKRGRP